MSSTEQSVSPCLPARRPIGRGRRVRWAFVVMAFAVLVSACGITPYAAQTITGAGTLGTVSNLGTDDASYYTTFAVCTGGIFGCTTDWVGAWNAGSAISSTITVSYTGWNAFAPGFQFISVWNWRTWSWVTVDAWRVVGTVDVKVERTLPQPTSDWVTSKGVGFVRVLTIGAMSSSSADVLLGCEGTAC